MSRRSGRPTALHSKLKDEQPQEADARVGCWPQYELEAMDRKFVQRVERAIARGQEHPTTSANTPPATHLK
jgi:hypothetical protein